MRHRETPRVEGDENEPDKHRNFLEFFQRQIAPLHMSKRRAS